MQYRSLKERAERMAGRALAPLILLEWGAILTYFYCSNRLASFLHPSFRPQVLVTGLLLLLVSACVFASADDGELPETDCRDTDCAHTHGKLTFGRLLAFAVLLIPIALAARISPGSYGSVLIHNRGLAESEEAVPGGIPVAPATATAAATPNASEGPNAAVSQANDPPAPVEVGDLLIAAHSVSPQKDFDGQRVELNGQFFPGNASGSFELVRLLILCCAADAQPLAVRVETDAKPNLSDMAWAKVTGRVHFQKKGDTDIPVVVAETVTPIAPPADPFVYHGGSRPAAACTTTVVGDRPAIKFQLPPK